MRVLHNRSERSTRSTRKNTRGTRRTSDLNLSCASCASCTTNRQFLRFSERFSPCTLPSSRTCGGRRQTTHRRGAENAKTFFQKPWRSQRLCGEFWLRLRRAVFLPESYILCPLTNRPNRDILLPPNRRRVNY